MRKKLAGAEPAQNRPTTSAPRMFERGETLWCYQKLCGVTAKPPYKVTVEVHLNSARAFVKYKGASYGAHPAALSGLDPTLLKR